MRSRAFSFVVVTAGSLAVFGVLAGGAGCSALLGFDDTTLRTNELLPDGAIVTGDGAIVDPDGGLVTTDAAPSRLTATPSAIVLRRGASTDVKVEIERGADVTGDVTLRLANLPAGVTANSAILAAPASEGTITLKATAAAALGVKNIELVADGTALPTTPLALTVADPAGALDTTFDTDGFASDPGPGVATTFFALALAGDGKILAGGAGGAAALDGWVLRRFGAAGAAEAAFATQTTAALPAAGELHALALDGAGKIVCVGMSPPTTAGANQLTVVRLLATGAVDATFGTAGLFRLPALEAPLGSSGLGVAVQADGSIVVVGSHRASASVEEGVILRLKANGTRDAAFNSGTTLTVPTSRLVGVGVEATGAIVAGGSVTSDTPSYLLTKRSAAGAPDLTFGAQGLATFGNGYAANAFTKLGGGSFVVVGGTAAGAAQYTAGAAGPTGTAIFSRALAVSAGASFFAIAPQDDKRFIAAGHTAVTNGEARVERINDTGVRDTSFGTAGVAVIEPSGAANGVDVTLFAAAVQKDGRILVAGNRSTGGGVVYRLWP